MTFPPPISAATPQDFFRPGVDEGLWLLRPESMEPVPFERANITWISLASDHRVRLTTDMLMRTHPSNGNSLLFPTVIAYAQDVTVSQSYMAIGGKYLLNSAGALRIRGKAISAKEQDNDGAKDAALTRYLAAGAREAQPLEVWKGADPRDLDFVIDTRNFHNFYHFTKEALSLLTLYGRYGLRGRIIFYSKNTKDHKVGDFVQQSIQAWFPELADRIEVTGSNRDGEGYSAPAALIAYDTISYFLQSNKNCFPNITRFGVKVERKPGLGNARDMGRMSVESPLVSLRERAMRYIDRSAPQKLRLYVERRSTRSRPVVQEHLLTDILKRHGFRTIAFEDSIVPEQAALVANCEAMVSIHGAGMTNMLYAPIGAKVFELSNTQTLVGRFGDFNPIANAASVTYAHIYLDHDHDDPSIVPRIVPDKHRGVRLTPFSAAAAAGYILATLDPQAAQDAKALCEAANAAGDFEQLEQLLDQHQDIISHIADYHVWRANLAAQRQDRSAVLRKLIHALMLAPRRIMLIKRLLPVAIEFSDQVTFEFAARQLHRIDEAEFIAFFDKHKWPIPANVTLSGGGGERR
ncbi:conserved hypothetical protein [Ketogulonicigenium vulgare Y25]|uniref:glycosyltransferase 61 family protein n=1 Tax=Ketogulonicigenium vulgare TaxID=92945 RepID=UPI0001E66EE5|nr:glycosyltransferase family 61 protein [Ketogulonicigenium vulgare]ADO42455.1 conserved hypothetical protein [Ketogulonicigenium vulgare Y25]